MERKSLWFKKQNKQKTSVKKNQITFGQMCAACYQYSYCDLACLQKEEIGMGWALRTGVSPQQIAFGEACEKKHQWRYIMLCLSTFWCTKSHVLQKVFKTYFANVLLLLTKLSLVSTYSMYIIQCSVCIFVITCSYVFVLFCFCCFLFFLYCRYCYYYYIF